MKQVLIKENEAGQRLDKYLHKYLKEAQGSFIYKMLRKKNIILNGKKASGGEKLEIGDEIRFFLSEKTLNKMSGIPSQLSEELSDKEVAEYKAAYDKYKELEIIYDNHHILIVNKPEGILTQKAAAVDLSLNEWFIGYMLHHGQLRREELRTFRPSVCNRLDRNTSGMVICGKTLPGSQKMSELLKNRDLHKFYRLYVKGKVTEPSLIEGYLVKDEKRNTVRISPSPVQDKSSYIKTKYEPLKIFEDKTLLEVELITGKTHQIRAHLASVGHPLLGDYKYGDKNFNDSYKKKYKIKSQLLHAYRLEFPELDGEFSELSKRIFTARAPQVFYTLEENGHK